MANDFYENNGGRQLPETDSGLPEETSFPKEDAGSGGDKGKPRDSLADLLDQEME